ncbi:MAG: hypothetical protein M3N31_05890 [Actinomycetota bacterium]|nr:hypothetical protein [Actinomycetota bacterium]
MQKGSRPIYVPDAAGDRERQVRVAEEELAGRGATPVTDEEVAAETGLPVEQVRQAREVPRVVASLDQPVGEDDTVLGELVAVDPSPPADEAAGDAVARDDLLGAVGRLPPLEGAVVRARFGLDDGTASSIAATARRLRVSERRVRELEARALAALARAGPFADAA